MLSRRHVALAIAVLLLASPSFAAEKEATKKEKKAAVRVRLAVALERALVRVLPAGYSANHRVSLLRNPKVQEDLKLDEKQAAAIKKTFDDLNAKRREIYAPIPGITRQERTKIIAEASRELQKYTAEQHNKLIEGLKAEQSQRLDQIMVQTQGIRALDDPKIAKELKISDEQKKKMAEARASVARDRRKLSADIRGRKFDRTKYREKLQELAKAGDQEVLDVLSKEQQEQFEKMKGKKIELGRVHGGVVVPFGPGRIIHGGIRIEVKPALRKPATKPTTKKPAPKKP
ncbi:MAG: hypothetical protein IID44_19495 [Planctomycetes bacterium]|nr:hypothetical protein [Planctomycetota bacterium]